MSSTIVGYTDYPLEHALVVLRLAGPLRQIGWRFLKGNEYPDDYQILSLADAVVVQRDFPRYETTYRQVVAHARQFKKPLIYEIDDLLWALPPDHPDGQGNYYSPALIPMLHAAMEADAVTVSTPGLYGYVHSINPNVWLLPNYLNDQIWSFRLPKPPEKNKSPIVIGYIGGLGTHEHDLRMILPAIQRILQCFDKSVLFKFWGTKPPSELLDRPNVQCVPLAIRNYAEYALYCLSQECDILIAPLQPNPFNQCKSHVKFLEYAALGVPGVYSQIDPYQLAITHGKNGFLASTMDEWYECLTRLIETPLLRYEVALNAQNGVRKKWLLADHAQEWVDVYEQVSATLKLEKKTAWRSENLVSQLVAEEIGKRDVRIQVLEAQLTESKTRLSQIISSDSWKLVQILRKLRLFMIPATSFRERIARKGMRELRALKRKFVLPQKTWE